jgi:uncharacterized protein (DUF849 family)
MVHHLLKRAVPLAIVKITWVFPVYSVFMAKMIITAALTGGEPVHKGMTPYVPSSPEEIAEETLRCWEAGASIVHLHAKDPETGRPAKDPNPYFTQYAKMIRDRCDIIISMIRVGSPTSGTKLMRW